MTKLNQTQSGKALEYQLAVHLANRLSIPLVDLPETLSAKICYDIHSKIEQEKIVIAAEAATSFLLEHDKSLLSGISVFLQPDMKGGTGDVRDIVVTLPDGDTVGISSKNRHDAVKHSRLSDTIDFGKKWAGCPSSSIYMERVKPIFEDLREKAKQKMLFRDISDKENRYYLPILAIFEDELRRLCDTYGQTFVKGMFHYLLGRYDFYKVIKENGHVSIQSFNFNGDLAWGRKWKIPDRITFIERKRGSLNTLLVSLDGGWVLSFRVHNASTYVEPSLKFDVRFIGMPPAVDKNHITLNYESIAPETLA